jgi:glycosyltransferase involved in cell wall biosynthesis
MDQRFASRARSLFDVVMLTTVHRATDTRIFHREAKTLAAGGLTVCILGPNPSQEDAAGVYFERLAAANTRLRRLLMARSVLKQCLKMKAKLYIFHDPELFGVGLVLSLLGKKVIYDRHENLPVQMLQKGWLPGPARWLLVAPVWLAEWICARLVAGVIVATDGMLRSFPRRKTVLVRNYPSRDTCEILARSTPVHLRRNIVIYAGGLSEIRGIRELVEAFRGIPGDDVELWLVAEFESEQFRDGILATLPGNAKWLGWKTHSEVLELYQLAKIGMLLLYPTPSHRRSLPVKLFEYLAAGLPIVASNFPEFTDFLEGCGLMVDPRDVSQIQAAIIKILSNASIVAEMSARARNHASTSFSWEPEGQRLLRFCSERMSHG